MKIGDRVILTERTISQYLSHWYYEMSIVPSTGDVDSDYASETQILMLAAMSPLSGVVTGYGFQDSYRVRFSIAGLKSEHYWSKKGLRKV